MTWLDIMVVIIILISTIYSFYRGLIKEFFSFVALLGGYLAANRFYISVKNVIEALLSRDIPGWSIYIVIFVLSALIFSSLEKLVKKIFNISITLKVVDHIGGALIGFFKGALVLSLIMLPLYSLSITRPILDSSTTPPYLLETFKVVKVLSSANIVNSYENNVRSLKKRVSSSMKKIKKAASGNGDITSKAIKKYEEISEEDKEKLGKLLKKEMEK